MAIRRARLFFKPLPARHILKSLSQALLFAIAKSKHNVGAHRYISFMHIAQRITIADHKLRLGSKWASLWVLALAMGWVLHDSNGCYLFGWEWVQASTLILISVSSCDAGASMVA